jgi:predicted metalloprotease with PDZ domain
VTYTRAQIEATLNEVEPYDWHAFFEKYVYSITEHPPTDELARAGWKIEYTSESNPFIKAEASTRKTINGWYSFGADISGKGTIRDVRENSAAWKAGLAPGMVIHAVDGQTFDPDVLDYAVKQAQHGGPAIVLIVSQTDWFKTISLDYHDGWKYPHLVRIDGTPDMLASIAAPHAK